MTDRSEGFPQEVRDRFDPVIARHVLRAFDWALARSPQRERELARLGRLLLAHHADHISLASMLLTQAAPADALSELSAEFGAETTQLVSDTRNLALASVASGDAGTPDLRALMESMTRDVRAVFLNAAFRVSELESAAASTRETADVEPLAREALDVHVPIAERLGFYQLRRRLEDAAFRILEPEVYRELATAVAPIQGQDDACMAILVDGVLRLLSRNGVAAEVTGRTKGLHSLYQKMLRTELPVDQIMDRVGVRVIVDAVPTCYQVLGLVHSHFCPIPGTFNDYIGRPKENGYQSLHTCVHPLLNTSAKPVEFQIRTAVMHANAEFGAAAHWRYKSVIDADCIRSDQLRWLKDLSARCRDLDSPEFVEELRRQVYEEQIVVFEEGGRQLRLPVGSTVHDFLHRTRGRNHKLVTVHVNGTRAGEDHVLRDGDTLDTSTSRPAQAPPSAGVGEPRRG